MFAKLTTQFSKALRTIGGRGQFTERNIAQALDEVRSALIEADVALPVIEAFLGHVRMRALGQDVIDSLRPEQAVIQIVHECLVELLGRHPAKLEVEGRPPQVVLVTGLQGAGKTTTVGKLGNWLKEHQKKTVMVTSTDVNRPAAMAQLARVSEQANLQLYQADAGTKPKGIAKAALKQAKQSGVDVLIVDTAGRLAIDEAMMDEVKVLNKVLDPSEVLFVVDSMTGQDAANTAKAFGEALPLTGVVLTKTDGDSRGGAILSVRHITGKPIKFIGVGERLHELQAFDPERIAGRILDMGDMMSLFEEAQRKVDAKQAEAMAKKVKKGKFDLNDLDQQLQLMQDMGGAAAIMDKLPGMGAISASTMNKLPDAKQTTRMQAIIRSMTPMERELIDIVKGSRLQRIAKGAGVLPQDVKQLLRQFKQMSKMVKMLQGNKMHKLMRQLSSMPGGLGGLGGGKNPFGL